MADTRNDPKSTEVENPRKARLENEQRLRLVRDEGKPKNTVTVYAANGSIRRVIRHPSGVKFGKSISEGVEWPNDSFTQRRLAEGSVRADGPGPEEVNEIDPSLNVHQQLEAAYRTKTQEAPKDNGGKTTKPPQSPPPAA